jgi:AraC family transcriptional regulator
MCPPRRVAIMEHRGDPATLGATIQRFIAWRTAAGLHPKTSPTFNVWRSERRPASPADYSVDLCVGTSGLLNSGQGGSRAAIALPVDEDAAIRFQDQLVTLDLQYERKSV